MVRGQLLSLILARQHQKVADPWSRTIARKIVIKIVAILLANIKKITEILSFRISTKSKKHLASYKTILFNLT